MMEHEDEPDIIFASGEEEEIIKQSIEQAALRRRHLLERIHAIHKHLAQTEREAETYALHGMPNAIAMRLEHITQLAEEARTIHRDPLHTISSRAQAGQYLYHIERIERGIENLLKTAESNYTAQRAAQLSGIQQSIFDVINANPTPAPLTPLSAAPPTNPPSENYLRQIKSALRRKTRHSCTVCGEVFYGRRDAKTCSAACRKLLQRQAGLWKEAESEAESTE